MDKESLIMLVSAILAVLSVTALLYFRSTQIRALRGIGICFAVAASVMLILNDHFYLGFFLLIALVFADIGIKPKHDEDE